MKIYQRDSKADLSREKKQEETVTKPENMIMEMTKSEEQKEEKKNVFNKFIYLFFGCVGSSLLHTGFPQLRRAGVTLRHGTQASFCSGFSLLQRMGSRAQAQQLQPMGLVAPQNVGCSQTRARTHAPCIGRQILNHCATREGPERRKI